MSEYSDAMTVQMSRAEESYLREPDAAVEDVEASERQFLGFDPDLGVWRLVTAGGISAHVQYAHYSGDSPLINLMVLDPVGGPAMVAVNLVQVGETETDRDDYMHTSYELRTESGEVVGAFTTRIDGRS